MTSFITTNDGCKIAYDYQHKPNKKTIVLANSLGTTMQMWQPQLEALGEHYSVLCYDMRGHGESSVMPGAYSLDRLGCDLIALLDSLELSSVYFCGLSIGGMIAQWLAVRHPERVEALVLANTSAYAGPVKNWDDRLKTIESDGLQSTWPMVRQRWVSDEFASLNPDIVNQLKGIFDTNNQQGYTATCQAVRDMDMRNLAKLNQLPSLIIAGEFDIASPLESSEFLLRQLSNAQLEVLQAGHLSNIEQPIRFNQAVLDFLRDIDY